MGNTDSEFKDLNSGLVGAAGSAICILIMFMLLQSAPGNEPPAGLVMLNLLMFLFAVTFWISGLIHTVMMFIRQPKYRSSGKAIVIYILLSAFPLLVLLALLVP